ncbi:uracil-DNA glycosylase [Paracrocinitomix mangrovi]|uniref:uracil-DNA glycosylase n=1 Tax=Paracrocinitomix mangrovi TaxID=2862509 RepID=UPI001C8DB65B|nr:uracil-DNA glycosylase [Paracrocinitomix mangrovi]UKN02845.1 uracil-DNA glycosylase [Paracrocinitomix mangrovi]
MNVDIEESWKTVLHGEFDKPYFVQLVDNVKQAYQKGDVWPKGKNIFNAFNQCPFNEVKVVILGQDPYPTPGHAHGLCFSVQKDVKPFPKSLNNIFKEINTDLGIEIPENGNLERWAEQGVFMLNTVLTVNAHEANSHKSFGWETFTDQVISSISNNLEGVVFLLWGSQAQKKIELIDQSKHHILKTVHPSPLSAHRGFFGCKHFSKANELLISHDRQPIQW